MSTILKWSYNWGYKKIILFITNLDWKQVIEIGIYIKNYDEIEMTPSTKFASVLQWIISKGFFHTDESSSTLRLTIELILRYTRNNPKEFKIQA